MLVIRLEVPEIRARDALAAVEERPFDCYDHGKLGHAAAFCHRAPDILIPNDNGPAGDPQRFALTGNEEDQADARILQHVVESIHPPVAAAIRNCKRCIVKKSDESSAVSLWREINHAKRIG